MEKLNKKYSSKNARKPLHGLKNLSKGKKLSHFATEIGKQKIATSNGKVL